MAYIVLFNETDVSADNVLVNDLVCATLTEKKQFFIISY